jgi:succinate dehydrogenase / fumarate reductase flavoprotein subunit
VGGEANFSDHGANRLGASALMQGLADGYFVLPYTVSNYLARGGISKADVGHRAFKEAEREVRERVEKLLAAKGKRTVDSFHRELGNLLWNDVGMARSEKSLKEALAKIPAIREEFHRNVRVLGIGDDLNQELEKAGRVADFLELAELLATDALHRNESCGGHFRVEYATPDGEAQRNDAEYAYVAAWEWKGPGQPWALTKEPLAFETVHLATRAARSRWPSTATAARASAACAASSSTALPTGPPAGPSASCTCATSATARSCGWSRGAPPPSRC